MDWVPLNAATNGIDYSLSYLTEGDFSGYTLLTVGEVGDFDSDGDVDGNDFLVWQRNPNLGSLAEWQDIYGAGGSLSAKSATVPEPGSEVFCLLMLLSWAAERKIAKKKSTLMARIAN